MCPRFLRLYCGRSLVRINPFAANQKSFVIAPQWSLHIGMGKVHAANGGRFVIARQWSLHIGMGKVHAANGGREAGMDQRGG